MTDRERIKKMRERLPEEGPPFQFRPDRWYIGMWHAPFPALVSRFKKGGDITAQAWGLNANVQEWHFMFRFRHYKYGPESCPWETRNDDHKSWYMTKTLGSADRVETTIRTFFDTHLYTAAEAFKTKLEIAPEFLKLHCDGTEAMKIILKVKPDWMHMREAKAEDL